MLSTEKISSTYSLVLSSCALISWPDPWSQLTNKKKLNLLVERWDNLLGNQIVEWKWTQCEWWSSLLLPNQRGIVAQFRTLSSRVRAYGQQIFKKLPKPVRHFRFEKSFSDNFGASHLYQTFTSARELKMPNIWMTLEYYEFFHGRRSSSKQMAISSQ